MKKNITAVVFLVIAFIVTASSYRSYSWLVIGLATILGYALGRINELQNGIDNVKTDLTNLTETMRKDWNERHRDTSASEETAAQVTVPKNKATDTATHTDDLTNTLNEHKIAHERKTDSLSASRLVSTITHSDESDLEEAHSPKPNTSRATTPVTPLEPDLFERLGEHVKGYFTGGNLFVRIGILILFTGVSFLIKFISDQGLLPIEFRLMGVAAGAIGLLAFGWYLRLKKPGYALLIQGAGIGILYLDIFGAFSMYQLIPALPAFTLLFIVSMLSAALAVLQDSRALAMLGFAGGFVAPVLASSGSGNYVGLFSYYAILNTALVAVAWFKSWRPLNLLGFTFTFIIGSMWGYFDYSPDKFSTTEPFLILFFVFYVIIAVLFALRQPPKLRGYVDGTLLFGVPLAASALQYILVRDMTYGVALSSFGFGAFYIVLAFFLWQKAGDKLKLLSEAFLALGVIFASLAIPFALAPEHTAAAWGLEGLGMIWLGSRQNRLSVRMFGLLLQLGAGALVIWHHNFLGDMAFINSSFISALMMAIAGIFSARLLYKQYEGKQNWEMTLSPVLLMWGLIWLIGGFAQQVSHYYPQQYMEHSMLAFCSILSILFTAIALRTKPVWQHSWYVAIALLPVMILTFVTTMGRSSLELTHPGSAYGWVVWPFAIAAYYWLLHKLEKTKTKIEITPLLHAGAFLLVIVLLVIEGSWHIKNTFDLARGWQTLWWAIPVIAGLVFVTKANLWPVNHHVGAYRHYAGITMAFTLGAWSLYAIVTPINSDPLTWVPVLNPVDIMLGIVILTLVSWWKQFNNSIEVKTIPPQYLTIGISALVFLWMNFTVFRIAHHWFDITYSSHGLFNSTLVQTTVSILWALTGVVITVLASRREHRHLWIAGGILLALVVLKLLLVDLSELSGIGRIISFMIVGGLLTSIGYFAPLPDDKKVEVEK